MWPQENTATGWLGKDFMDNNEKNTIATLEEISEYLTSVVRGDATSEVIVNENGKKVHMNKSPEIKEKLKAAELLYKNISAEKSDSNGLSPVIIVDDIGYDE